jgi:hypothetical protein
MTRTLTNMFVTNKFAMTAVTATLGAGGVIPVIPGRGKKPHRHGGRDHYRVLTLDRTHVTAGTKTGLTGVVSIVG